MFEIWQQAFNTTTKVAPTVLNAFPKNSLIWILIIIAIAWALNRKLSGFTSFIMIAILLYLVASGVFHVI